MSLIKRIGFLTAFIIPSLVIIGFYLGGWWNYLTVGFVFIIIPLLDYLIGEDPENMDDANAMIVSEKFYYRLITFIWTYFQIAFVMWGCYVISVSELVLNEWIGFVMSFALVTGGIGITVAHELGHKKAAHERFYSKLLLMTVSYMHFYIEHNKGHHVHVATPRDPATGHKGENFYRFWLRSVVGSYRSALNIEASRLQRKGVKVNSVNNSMIWFTMLPILFCSTILVVLYFVNGFWSLEVAAFFFTQSIIAFTLLELVNYIEHYGIMRKEIKPGVFERVNPMHSWNSNHRLSNFFLFQLQRHSDHHANAIKRYQVLKHYDESPQLPSGYPAMIMMAAVPPVWFKYMNPKLEEWERAVYKAS